MTPEDKTLLLVEDDRPLREERRPSRQVSLAALPSALGRATIKQKASAT
jgi:hypothetical protein